MRRVVILSLLCVIALPFITHAQKQLKGKWALTFTPALIPLPSGGQFGIQPGFEYSFSNKISWLNEVTFQTGKKQHADSAALDKEYFRIKTEIRYHFLTKSSKLTTYVGLQGSYSFRSFRNEKHGFYYDAHLPYDTVYFFDKANISSPITTISLQFGAILSDGKRFAADVFAGTGLRLVNTHFSHVQNLRQDQRVPAPYWFTATASYQKNGWVSDLHLNAGVRFMFRFGRMQ